MFHFGNKLTPKSRCALSGRINCLHAEVIEVDVQQFPVK